MLYFFAFGTVLNLNADEPPKKKEPKFIKFVSRYAFDFMIGENGRAIGNYKNSINENFVTMYQTPFYDNMTPEEQAFSYAVTSKNSKIMTRNNYISMRFYEDNFYWGLMMNPKFLRVTQAYPSEDVIAIMSSLGLIQDKNQARLGNTNYNEPTLNYLYYLRRDTIIPILDLYWLFGYEYNHKYVKPYITFGIPIDFFSVFDGYFHSMVGIKFKVYNSIHLNVEGYHMRYYVPEYKKVNYNSAGDVPNLFDTGVRFGVSFINEPD